jgi:Domain of unknown function (DUF4259)
MGTWDVGPFDNDPAADFADALDDAPPAERVELIRGALLSVIDEYAYLDAEAAAPAVAAAAVAAAHLPGGQVFQSRSFGPRSAIPPLPPNIMALTVPALDRVLGSRSQIGDLWDEAGYSDENSWREMTEGLRNLLAMAGPKATAPCLGP